MSPLKLVFQEASAQFIDFVLAQIGSKYAVADPGGVIDASCYILYHRDQCTALEATIAPLPGTQMHRHLVMAVVQHRDWRLMLGTTHLESGVAAAPIRSNQLRHVLRLVEVAASARRLPMVLAGDFNLRDEETRLSPPWIDAWQFLGSNAATRPTWVGGAIPYRFDRLFVAGGRLFTPETFRLCGVEPGPSPAAVSDHHGIICRSSTQTSSQNSNTN